MRKIAVLAFLQAVLMQGQTQSWDRLVDRYFEEAVFRYGPSAAVQAGFHNRDSDLEDLSAAAIHRQVAALRDFEREFEAFPGAQADRELLLANIRSTLLGLESIRMWEKNPDLYSSTLSNGAFVIMSRAFAPAVAQRPRRLAVKIDNDEVVAGVQNLPEMQVAVTANALHRHLLFQEGDEARLDALGVRQDPFGNRRARFVKRPPLNFETAQRMPRDVAHRLVRCAMP